MQTQVQATLWSKHKFQGTLGFLTIKSWVSSLYIKSFSSHQKMNIWWPVTPERF